MRLAVIMFGLTAFGCSEGQQALIAAPSPIAANVATITEDRHDGISCPSEAPIVRVSSYHGRLDVEWRPVADISEYGVAVEEFHEGGWRHVATETSPATYLAVYPKSSGLYRARVRSLRCNGVGEWSAWVEHRIDSGPGGAPSTPGPTGPSGPTLVAGPVCTDAAFFPKGVSVVLNIAVPDGPHTLLVTTKDANHTPGYQPGQTNERLGVYLAGPVFVGLTDDIPEAETSVTTSFAVTGPSSAVGLRSEFNQSVHGACVSVYRG